MDNLCKHCGICCKLIPVDIEHQIILRDGLQKLENKFARQLILLSDNDAININETYVNNVQSIFKNVRFFRCKLLSEKKLCTAEDKPDICKSFPSHPLAVIPDECGYYGKIFLASEEVKQKVRRYKEEIIYYKAMMVSNCKEEKIYRKIIASLEHFIEKYKPFGAEDW